MAPTLWAEWRQVEKVKVKERVATLSSAQAAVEVVADTAILFQSQYQSTAKEENHTGAGEGDDPPDRQ